MDEKPVAETFEERMKQKQEAEQEAERQKQESLTQDYLKRTGRKEIKP